MAADPPRTDRFSETLEQDMCHGPHRIRVPCAGVSPVSGEVPALCGRCATSPWSFPGRDEHGQTTAEYALVLLVVGLVVGVLAAFVKSGALSEMFEQILSGLVDRAGG